MARDERKHPLKMIETVVRCSSALRLQRLASDCWSSRCSALLNVSLKHEKHFANVLWFIEMHKCTGNNDRSAVCLSHGVHGSHERHFLRPLFSVTVILNAPSEMSFRDLLLPVCLGYV